MIEYTLIRSDRRTLGLEITPQLTVVVRAPRRCRQADIDRFVAAHGDWIDRHLEVQRRRQAARAARQVTPEQEAELRRRAEESAMSQAGEDIKAARDRAMGAAEMTLHALEEKQEYRLRELQSRCEAEKEQWAESLFRMVVGLDD